RAAGDLRGDRDVPEPPDLDDRRRLQPDGVELRGGRQHAPGLPDRRHHRDAVRPGLYRRRLLLLPRQDPGRRARLLTSPRGPRGARRPGWRRRRSAAPNPAARLLDLDPAAGRTLWLALGAGACAAVAWVGIAVAMSVAIAGTIQGTLMVANTGPLLAVLAGLVV